MKLPFPMIEMFARSAGVPDSAIDLLKLLMLQGLSALKVQAMSLSDPDWNRVGYKPESVRLGWWLTASGPTSRASCAIFYEGQDDETFRKLSGLAVPALAGDGVPSVGPAIPTAAARE